jgi:DNA modification methylase
LIDGNNKIICGHGRVAGARLLGLTKVPTLKLAHLSDADKRAYIIADNRLAEKAGWNKEFLAIELQGLLDLNFEIELTGFETCEVDLLLEDINAGSEENDDICPEYEPSRAITKLGDVWNLGPHRLVCGDARDRSAYALLMGNECAQLTTTDPPYNLKIDGHVSGLGRVQHREFAMGCGEMSEAEFATFLEQTFQQIAAHSIDGAICSTFINWRHLSEILVAGRKVFSELKNVCVWVNPNGGTGTFYRSRHQLVFIWKHGKSSHRNTFELGQYGRFRTNVWEYAGVNSFKTDRLNELEMHPTVKPVAMIADAIKDCSRRGDLILDPFSGSGTTIAAAQRTGRRARAIEIDPNYCDVAIRRWQGQTGQRAVHAKTGLSFDDLEERFSSTMTRRGHDECQTKERRPKKSPRRRAR